MAPQVQTHTFFRYPTDILVFTCVNHHFTNSIIWLEMNFSWAFWINKCLLWISMQTNGNGTTSVWNNFLREPSKSVGIHGDENVTFLSSVDRKFKSKLNWKWHHKCAKYFFERTKFFSARIDGNEMIVLLTELENEHNISLSNWLS